MRVKDQAIRRAWTAGAYNSKNSRLARAYLSSAEKWADKIEEVWDGDDTSFGATARQAHTLTMGEFDELELHAPDCDVMVDYLEHAWELGDKLRQWYGDSSFMSGTS